MFSKLSDKAYECLEGFKIQGNGVVHVFTKGKPVPLRPFIEDYPGTRGLEVLNGLILDKKVKGEKIELEPTKDEKKKKEEVTKDEKK